MEVMLATTAIFLLSYFPHHCFA